MNLHYLIRDCQLQKRKAQKQLYELLADQLFWTIKKFFKSDEDAEDILTDSFLIIYQKLNTLQSPEALFNWAKKITIRNCLKKIHQDQALLNLEDSVGEPFVLPQADNEIDGAFLLEMTEHLPKGCKSVFILYEIEGYTHKEIAEMLQISTGTSKSQLNVAKSKLRKILDKYYFEKT